MLNTLSENILQSFYRVNKTASKITLVVQSVQKYDFITFKGTLYVVFASRILQS